MSTQNIENPNPEPKIQEKIHNNKQNQQLLEEIRNLKKVVSLLAQKQSLRQKQQTIHEQLMREAQENNPESDFLQSKIKRSRSKEAKVQKGQDIYKNVRNDWKVRITSRQKGASHLNKESNIEQKSIKVDQSKLNLISQKQEQKTNLDESIINKHLSFLNSRSDTEQQQPAKTQFFAPQIKNNEHAQSSNEFRFKKINIIPAIQTQHNRFRSYITSQRKNMINTRSINSRQSSSLAFNNKNSFSVSQPQINKKKTQRYGQNKQSRVIEQLKYIQVTRQTSKQLLVQNGKRLFKLFYDQFNEETNFSIKRYKNCIVFSLMPAITKAIIYHYVGDLYFGNVSLDEKGRIEKNGIGIQIIKQRHYFEGHFINGKKNGRGKIQYENGDVYEGQWNQGQIYGFGRYIENKNDRFFEGFWRRGEYCGQKTAKQQNPFQFF